MKKILFGVGIAILISAGIYALMILVPTMSAPKAPSLFALPADHLVPATDTLVLGPHRQAPQGHQEYYNEVYRFSLFYPENLSVKTYDEGGGAATVVFQNPAEVVGFQIFVTPYGASQITEDQFKKDEPSGVRKGMQTVTIDSVVAASFYSVTAVLGETAEVWFVHGGYLYEVTTLKTLAPRLEEWMQTWKFI